MIKDLDVEFMGGDSARLGHEPAIIPPFPSVVSNLNRISSHN